MNLYAFQWELRDNLTAFAHDWLKRQELYGKDLWPADMDLSEWQEQFQAFMDLPDEERHA